MKASRTMASILRLPSMTGARNQSAITRSVKGSCRSCPAAAIQVRNYFESVRYLSTRSSATRQAKTETVSSSNKLQFPRLDELEKETNVLLERLDSTNHNSTTQQKITSQYCYRILESWMALARDQHSIDAAKRAEEILHRLEHTTVTALAPTSLFYDLVLQAYAVCGGGRPAAEAAQTLLEHMVRVRPTAKSYNIVIHCWAKSRASDAGEKAQSIFRSMTEVQPNARTLTGVLEAWAQSGHREASTVLVIILEHAVEKLRIGEPASAIPLDVVVFHTVLRAVARLERNRQGAEKAEKVLRLLEELHAVQPDGRLSPTTQTYSLILHAWAQCESQERQGDAAKRAENILELMIELYRQGRNVKPNTRSFTTCISAWSNVPNGAERAESLLQRMMDLYHETKDPELMPDTAAGNAVLTAWSRSKSSDAPQRTKDALAKLEKYATPDLISYNCLLYAHGMSGNVAAASELIDWLEMKGSSDRPDLQPDVVSYNCLIHAFAKSGSREAALEAQGLMARMKQLASGGERPNVRPTNFTYTSVVNAWSNSNDPSPASRAFDIFEEFLSAHESDRNNRDLHPDMIMFVAVIQACAKEQVDKATALKMALNAFEKLCQSPVSFNELAFCAILEASNNLCSAEEEWVGTVQPIFKLCCETGCLSRRVLAILRRGSKSFSSAAFEKVIGPTDTNRMPSAWSRKIPKRHCP